MFIDRVEIGVRAGGGGDGCVSFRREKHVPRGGPDGGNGGRGGDVIIKVDGQMRTLLDLRYRKQYRAESGRPGGSARKTGRSGKSTVIRVPPGTVVEDAGSGEVLADLTGAGQEIIAACGGDGGRGNYAFRSSVNQAPRRRTEGSAGEERRLLLTLKLIADVGLVGLPNAGKSTLLRSLSDAQPVVASYPFSTLAPVLGIVRVDEAASFCMVDIPGLIEGAHMGRGLGIEFLRHIERCRVLVLIMDVAGETTAEEAYDKLLGELGSYSEKLLDRPRVVALNKVDLIAGAEPEAGFLQCRDERLFRISALTGEGLKEFVPALYKILNDPPDGGFD